MKLVQSYNLDQPDTEAISKFFVEPEASQLPYCKARTFQQAGKQEEDSCVNTVQFHMGNNPKITTSDARKEIAVQVLEIVLRKSNVF